MMANQTDRAVTELTSPPSSRTRFITAGTTAIRFSAPDADRVLPRALEGIRAQYLARDCALPQVLELDVTADEAHVKYGDTECRVQLPHGPQLFAASVALPLIGVGDHAGDYAKDLLALLGPRGRATFHRLEDVEQIALPASLATARGAIVTYFGTGVSRPRLEEIVGAVRGRLPVGAGVVAAMVEMPHHHRRVLVTVVEG